VESAHLADLGGDVVLSSLDDREVGEGLDSGSHSYRKMLEIKGGFGEPARAGVGG
jgi:hypothetical protein